MTATLVEATADRLWIVANGTVKSYDGDIESYRQDLLSDRSAKDRARRAMVDANGGTGESRNIRAATRKAAADKRAGLAPLKKPCRLPKRAWSA